MTGPEAGGAFWVFLFGILFFVPILGAAVGAGIGALPRFGCSGSTTSSSTRSRGRSPRGRQPVPDVVERGPGPDQSAFRPASARPDRHQPRGRTRRPSCARPSARSEPPRLRTQQVRYLATTVSHSMSSVGWCSSRVGRSSRGSEEFYPEEQPIGKVAVRATSGGRRIQRRFRRFVKDTGHLTVAEQPATRRVPDADPRPRSPGRWCSRRPLDQFRSTLAAVVALAAPGADCVTRTDPAASSTVRTGIRWCTSLTM